MKTIQIYDPPMCCSTGICGPEVDPDLVNFAAMLAQLSSHGLKVERYNLAQQAMAFVENPAVRELLEAGGAEVLPLIFIDGTLYMQGRYPTRDERSRFIQAAMGAEAEVVS